MLMRNAGLIEQISHSVRGDVLDIKEGETTTNEPGQAVRIAVTEIVLPLLPTKLRLPGRRDTVPGGVVEAHDCARRAGRAVTRPVGLVDHGDVVPRPTQLERGRSTHDS